MWKPIDEAAGLFGAEKWSKAGWHWRTTALRLPGGGSLVIGPLRGMGDEAHAELAAIGRPEAMLAPNHFHWMGLPEYRERYPDAVVGASEVAARRLGKKEVGRFATVEALAKRLPNGAELVVPPGLKNGEVWLKVTTGAGVVWVVSDAFFALEKNARGFTGFMLRATGTAPGLRIGRTFTGLAMGDKPMYRDWLLERIAADRPQVLIPGHGEVLAGAEVADRLDELTRARLGSPRKLLAA